jgi:hypothetical protein
VSLAGLGAEGTGITSIPFLIFVEWLEGRAA